MKPNIILITVVIFCLFLKGFAQIPGTQNFWFVAEEAATGVDRGPLLPSGTNCGALADGVIAHNDVSTHLSTSLADYNAATNGDFVQITKAEYEAIAAAADFDIVGSPPTANTASSFSRSYFEVFVDAAGGAAANKTYVAFGYFGGAAGDDINYFLSNNDGTLTSDWVSFAVTLDPVNDQTFWAVKNSSINFNTETRLGVHRTVPMYFGTGPTAYQYKAFPTPDCSEDVTAGGNIPLGITAIVR